MRIIEIIEMRYIKNKHIFDTFDFHTLLKNETHKITPATIKLYKHRTIDTDFSIHLHYDLGNDLCMDDLCGVYLSCLLKEWGLVNYSLWIEKKSFDQSQMQGGNDEKD